MKKMAKNFWICTMMCIEEEGCYYDNLLELFYGTKEEAEETFAYRAKQWENAAWGEGNNIEVYPEYVESVTPTVSTTEIGCWKEGILVYRPRKKYEYMFPNGEKVFFIDAEEEVSI